ncbi:MAG: carboxymethylenebutenolidase [Chitinophagales bacterium]|nr:MAG: carboxymethylenebutenolidase [Chitinophagales bacterium]
MRKALFDRNIRFFLICCITTGATMSAFSQAPSCHPAESFAMLSNDKAFREGHAEPEDFTYTGPGEWVTFPAADGNPAKGFLLKSEKPSQNYLLVFHEWWGLNDQIRAECATLAKDLQNVNILAVDLYDGKVTNQRSEAARLMQSVNRQRAEAIVKGVIQYVGPEAKIATIGWCFGGGWSLQASLLAGTRAAACVLYYGMPVTDTVKLKTLHADVLGIFASQDEWITQDIVKQFDAAMKAAGKRLDIVTFDAQHAFANPSNPQYDKEKTEKAYEYTLKFLKEHL